MQYFECQCFKFKIQRCSTRVVGSFFIFWLKIFIFEQETTKKNEWRKKNISNTV